MKLFPSVSAMILTVLMCFSGTAFAVQVPKSSPGDNRVRFVAYDAANVVQINGYFGYQTFILFSEGEIITDLGSGDTDGWAIGVVAAKNGFFIKPKGEKASTNLTVITTRRHYNFDLLQKHSGSNKTPYYMVRFTYPGEEAALLASKKEQEQLDELLNTEREGRPWNRNYWWDGSESLKPVEIWDNGTFTYFKFAPGREFPSVFLMDSEDPEIESTVNLHVENDTLVVHKTGERFILRLGNRVTGIINKSYNPDGVKLPKTVSPYIERQVRQ